MGMLGMFGEKNSGIDLGTGQYGGDMVGMMKMLGGMLHMMRKPMMKGRITQLLSLSEEKRQESIRDMIGAFNNPSAKAKTRESLVGTRLEIVGELPEDQRRTIIYSRTEALKVAPELDKADQRVQDQILPKVPQHARQAFLKSWDQVRKSSGE